MMKFRKKPETHSPDGFTDVARAKHGQVTTEFIRDLQHYSRVTAKRQGSEVVSKSHVEQAAVFLGTQRTRKGWVATGTVAALVGGAAGQQLFTELSSGGPVSRALVYSVLALCGSLVFAVIAIMRQ